MSEQQSKPGADERGAAFTALVQTDILTEVASQDPAEVSSGRLPLLQTGAGFVLGAALVAAGVLSGTILIIGIGGALLGAALIWLLFSITIKREVLQAHAKGLDEAYCELRKLFDLLTSYLEEIDSKTSGYLQTMSEKSSAYFALRQLQAGMRKLPEKAVAWADIISVENLLAIYEILQQPIHYHDGKGNSDGKPRSVMLGDLTKTVATLVAELERDLLELELEIEAWRRYAPEAQQSEKTE